MLCRDRGHLDRKQRLEPGQQYGQRHDLACVKGSIELALVDGQGESLQHAAFEPHRLHPELLRIRAASQDLIEAVDHGGGKDDFEGRGDGPQAATEDVLHGARDDLGHEDHAMAWAGHVVAQNTEIADVDTTGMNDQWKLSRMERVYIERVK